MKVKYLQVYPPELDGRWVNWMVSWGSHGNRVVTQLFIHNDGHTVPYMYRIKPMEDDNES